MWVVEGLDSLPDLPPGCFATVLKIHHCAIDGETGVSLISAIHQDTPDQPLEELEDNWEPEPVPGNRALIQRAWLNSIRHPVTIAKLLLSNANALVRSAVNELRSDDDDLQLLAPATILNGPISAHRIIDEARCTLDDIKHIRQQVAGATVNDVSIAIVAEGLRRYLDAKGELPEDSLITCMPISTRTPGQSRSGSNQLTISRISLHTNIADPMERLAAIAAETGRRKATQEGVVMNVLLDVVHSLPGALVGAVGSVLPLVLANSKAASRLPFNTLVTNVPGPREPIYFLGAKAVLMTGSMPLTDGGAVLHCVGGYNGSFNFTFTACRELLPDSDFYRECLQAGIDAYLDEAGKAPTATRGNSRKKPGRKRQKS
jgi:WS/DGAT/MGAT family acyltransferase